jgi:hypothetical protein
MDVSKEFEVTDVACSPDRKEGCLGIENLPERCFGKLSVFTAYQIFNWNKTS